jgi:hypothetical protein
MVEAWGSGIPPASYVDTIFRDWPNNLNKSGIPAKVPTYLDDFL